MLEQMLIAQLLEEQASVLCASLKIWKSGQLVATEIED